MSPREAAIRAVCKAAGAEPDTWRGFLHFANVGLDKLIELMPHELAEQVRRFLEMEIT